MTIVHTEKSSDSYEEFICFRLQVMTFL